MAGPPPTPAQLLDDATCILLDFDGPVCDLFRGHPAHDVAVQLRGWIERNVPGDVVVEKASADDPLALLRATAEQYPDPALVREMEQQLTAHEMRAAQTAGPTEGAVELIRRLDAAGRRLAVTTNNSAQAVEIYLDRHGLTAFFSGHIHGRTSQPALMKPDPHCLRQALRSTGSHAAESLMIGDSEADAEAAAEVKVPFLGFAREASKRFRLRAAKATVIVSTMAELLEAMDGGRPDRPVDDRPSAAQSS